MVGKQLPPRPVRPDEPPDIIAPVVGGLTELIFGQPGLFIDRPGFVAGAAPDTALGQAVQDLTRLNCRIWASSDKSDYSQAVNQGNSDLCGPYLDTLGEKPDPGTVGLPFTGGQCAGVSYRINWTDEQFFPDCSTLVGNPSVGGFIGPLGQVTYSGSSPCPNALGTTSRISTGAGNVVIGGAGGGVRTTINSVEREDLAPDNCGNPPPVIQPPTTVTPVTPIPPNINIELPGLGPIDITLELNPEGKPVVCIPELDICVTVEPPPTGDPGGGGDPPGGGPSDGPPGDVGQPGGGAETGEGGNAEGEAPEGSVLTGVRVEILEFPGSRSIYTDVVFRGAYYVYMGVPGLLDHDPAGAMALADQFVFAQKDNLTAWRVSANKGYNLRVTPYYREVEV